MKRRIKNILLKGILTSSYFLGAGLGFVQDCLSATSYEQSGATLLILNNGIGDTLCALSAAKAFRDGSQGGNFDCLATGENKELLENIGIFDQIITVERMKHPYSLKKLRKQFDIIKQLRRNNYKKVINLSCNYYTAWLGLLICSHQVGYEEVCKVGWFKSIGLRPFFKKMIGYKQTNILYEYYQIATNSNHPPASVIPDLPKNETAALNVSRILNHKKLGESRKLMVVCPFSRAPIKEWPAEYWQRLLEKISESDRWDIVVVGSKQEEAKSNRLVAACGDKVKNLCGKLKFYEAVELIRMADYFVGGDTASMHVAYMLKKPGIAIFGPTKPAKIVPSDISLTVLYSATSCSPCYQANNLDVCKHGHFQCMKEISCENIWCLIRSYEALNRDCWNVR